MCFLQKLIEFKTSFLGKAVLVEGKNTLSIFRYLLFKYELIVFPVPTLPPNTLLFGPVICLNKKNISIF